MSEWKVVHKNFPTGKTVLVTWADTWPENGGTGVHIEAAFKDEGAWIYAYDGDGPDEPPSHWMELQKAPVLT